MTHFVMHVFDDVYQLYWCQPSLDILLFSSHRHSTGRRSENPVAISSIIRPSSQLSGSNLDFQRVCAT